MTKFVTGTSLILELENLLLNASKRLVLISPYIKLHERYKHALKSKFTEHKLEVIVVFGKNENDITKSISHEDFEFFKQFANVELRYEPNLHAKYYSNYDTSILSSMNLYTYSQDNNIEAGIVTTNSLLTNLAAGVTDINNLDGDQHDYFSTVIDKSKLLYKNTPVLSGLLIKKMDSVKNEIDLISHLFTKPKSKHHYGYCISTGVEIKFNPEVPFSKDAYRQWSKNKSEPQSYCHYSGEPSNKETSFSKPILLKNWSKAKMLIN